jgi:diguanylate cyclase (GGDEF)-like protein/PAS domain S-box-containing protein
VILPPLVRSLLDATTDAAAVVDRDLQILHVNAAYLRLAGLRPRDVAGRDLREMCHRHFELESCAEGCVSRRAMESRRTCRVDEVRSTRLPLRVIAVSMPLFDEAGAAWGAIESYRDVTAESRMQENYRRLLEQERAKTEVAEAEVVRKNAELEQANHNLRVALKEVLRLANTDGLTGLWNRRFFDERFGAHLASAQRRGQPVSLVLFDLDHFKRVNDAHGHPAGDQTLRDFSEVLQRVAHDDDVAARFGGEEFALLLPGTSLAVAVAAANEVRTRVEAAHLLTTVSGGVAAYPGAGGTRTELLRAADQALYEAKHAGRNRIITAPDLVTQRPPPVPPSSGVASW